MIYLLIPLCALLYFIGGAKWAHTLIRDIGCPVCIVALTTAIFGWNWMYVLAFGAIWSGMTLGDHGKWYWSLHGLVIGLSMVVISIVWGLILAITVSAVTYTVSRFLNRYGADVWLRGLLYGSMPWILLKVIPS